MIFDIPPDPPKFWLPPKPAIIRSAPDLVRLPLLAHRLRRVSGLSAGPTSLTFVNSANAQGSTGTITIPADAAIGDIAVLFDNVDGNDPPSGTVPTGFTEIGTALGSGDTILRRSYRVLTTGEPGSSVTGMTGQDSARIMYVFRPNNPINSVITSTPQQENTTGNPVSQTVSASGQPTPLVVLAMCGVGTATNVAFSTASPAFDATTLVNYETSSIRAGYKIYNSSPADHSIDMNDLGARNVLTSFYLRVA